MEPEMSYECPLHGGGPSAQSLVGRRLTRVAGSWHMYGGDDAVGPLGVWLIDDQKAAVHITTGSDWCLIVEVSETHVGYDMGDSGPITVEAMGDRSPFAAHIGESVVAVWERHETNTGRMALELSFPNGRVRCESWGGDLRLTAVR